MAKAGRPVKDIVEYFPHYVGESRTLYILESKYGNDGYAAWFKLLTLLCTQDGHQYDYSKPSAWEFLQAKMRTDPISTCSILQTLAELEAIDPYLHEYKIIWCQKLVDNLAPVYRNRRREVPQKPIPTTKNGISTCRNTSGDELPPVETPQRKGKERKGNKPPGSPPCQGDAPAKKVYGEFRNVTLSDEEREKLTSRFGERDAISWIEELSTAKASKGYKSKSDYAMILSWSRRPRFGGKDGNGSAPQTRPERVASNDYFQALAAELEAKRAKVG